MQTINKKAKFNYNLFERFEAGISLTGGETKAVKSGKADLANAYAKIVDNQIFLVNVNIPVAGKKDYNPTRTRKVLMHKGEIISLKSKIQAKKLTLVPVRMYTKHRLVKLELALAKTKRSFEKKEAIKKKDIEREIAQDLSEKRKLK